MLIRKGHSIKSVALSWQFWASLSAAFAALTAIFAKIGIENVNSDFAPFIRTVVILCALEAILVGTGVEEVLPFDIQVAPEPLTEATQTASWGCRRRTALSAV